MKLEGVEKRGGWLQSEWRLTYRVGWGGICSAAELLYHYMDDPEVLVGGPGGESAASVSGEQDILLLEESGSLTIRGNSQILQVPVMITFFNQLDLVRVFVACATEEFAEADYRKFNLSMCQFLDSAEIAMYR